MRQTLARSLAATGLTLTLVATTLLPANAAQDSNWSPPVDISTPGRIAEAPQVVTDGSTITAIWRSFNISNFIIRAASSTNGGMTWSAPVNVSAGGLGANIPQLVTDGTTITAIWTSYDGATTFVKAARSTDGGATWSLPVNLSAAGRNALDPKLVTDGTTVTAVWRRFDGSDYRVQAAAFPAITDTGWSAPIDLSASGQSAVDPQLVTDGTTTTAMWSGFDGSHYIVQAATFPAATDSGWSTPVDVSAAGQTASAAQLVAGDTATTAVWRRSNGSHTIIQAATFPAATDTGWSTPVDVSAAGQTAYSPQVVAGGTTTTATWYRYDGANFIVQAASSTNGGTTWSTPVNLSAVGRNAASPQLAADDTTTTAVWVGDDGDDDIVQVATFPADTVTGWSDPLDLSAPGQSAVGPQLVTDGTTATAVWWRSDGSSTRIQSSSSPFQAATSRLAGADRYQTAVQISSEFAADVPVVYLATGTNYPDALSAASAAAFQGGPLLLTTPTTLPQVVRDELVRLNPALVVIAGSTGVVSGTVETQVKALLPSTEVRRDAGADRYATSRIVAERAFPAGTTTTAYIATGANFPDALSASAAAGVAAAPVILVNGAGTSIDSATEALLTTLGVENAFIAGGTVVVSSAIQSELAAFLSPGTVTRLSGADRYATSVAVNAASFDLARTAFLATGVGYADALAGAALAGSVGGPLYVVPRTCVPPAVLAELQRLRTVNVVLLGGTAALTTGVAALDAC